MLSTNQNVHVVVVSRQTVRTGAAVLVRLESILPHRLAVPRKRQSGPKEAIGPGCLFIYAELLIWQTHLALLRHFIKRSSWTDSKACWWKAPAIPRIRSWIRSVGHLYARTHTHILLKVNNLGVNLFFFQGGNSCYECKHESKRVLTFTHSFIVPGLCKSTTTEAKLSRTCWKRVFLLKKTHICIVLNTWQIRHLNWFGQTM